MKTFAFALAAAALSFSTAGAFASPRPADDYRPPLAESGADAKAFGSMSRPTVWGHMVDGSDYMFSGDGQTVWGHKAVR